MRGEMDYKWILICIILLVYNVNGQRPAVPANVTMDLEFVDGAPEITGKWNVTPSVEQYMLQLTVNRSSPVNTTVPASTTVVDIFRIFQTVTKERYTIYSLRVAAISSYGIGGFSDAASVVTKYLQAVSVIAGVKSITVSCRVATSNTRTICYAYFSPGTTDAYAYTFQKGTEGLTVDYAPGPHNVSVKVSTIINGNIIPVEESDFVVIVPSVSSSSLISATPLITTTIPAQPVSTITSSPLSPTSVSVRMTSSIVSSTSFVLLATPIAGTENPSGGGGGSVVVGAVMATVVVTTVMMIITIVLTVYVLLWWRHHKKGRGISDTEAPVPAPVPEKQPCKSPSINIETTSCPLYHYEDIDTIKDARYSMVNTVTNNKSRVNSAITSNHSSYVEMSSVTILSDKEVVMQPNPSYSTVDVTNS